MNVDGSARVPAAAAAADVKTLVYASSVGAYAAAPTGDRPLDEAWPATGIPTAFYGRHKARVEAMLDRFEAEHPDVRVVRLRPALTFKREAATATKRYAADPLIGPSEFGGLVDARIVEVPRRMARTAIGLSRRARLQATEPGWLDLAFGVPVMDTSRARSELGWTPKVDAPDAVAELLSGIPVRSAGETPVLAA